MSGWDEDRARSENDRLRKVLEELRAIAASRKATAPDPDPEAFAAKERAMRLAQRSGEVAMGILGHDWARADLGRVKDATDLYARAEAQLEESGRFGEFCTLMRSIAEPHVDAIMRDLEARGIAAPLSLKESMLRGIGRREVRNCLAIGMASPKPRDHERPWRPVTRDRAAPGTAPEAEEGPLP